MEGNPGWFGFECSTWIPILCRQFLGKKFVGNFLLMARDIRDGFDWFRGLFGGAFSQLWGGLYIFWRMEGNPGWVGFGCSTWIPILCRQFLVKKFVVNFLLMAGDIRDGFDWFRGLFGGAFSQLRAVLYNFLKNRESFISMDRVPPGCGGVFVLLDRLWFGWASVSLTYLGRIGFVPWYWLGVSLGNPRTGRALCVLRRWFMQLKMILCHQFLVFEHNWYVQDRVLTIWFGVV